MQMLRGDQKKYLRGIAHSLKPVVLIGQSGLTDTLIRAVDEALNTHELIKIRFNAFKEKEQKKRMIAEIENKTACQMVGMIGHIAILFREQIDPEKQKIKLPI